MRLSVAASLLFLSFHVQSNGVNAEGGLCNKERNSDYKCGSERGKAPYWPVTTTCTQNKCCCRRENGWDHSGNYQLQTCLDQDNSVIGCFACSGVDACNDLDNTHVGDSSCTGDNACRKVNDAIIGISSCNKKLACAQELHNYQKGSTSGTTIGDGSCNAEYACYRSLGQYTAPAGIDISVTIGNGSCNASTSDPDGGICNNCEAGSVVPDGTCNDVNNVDEVGDKPYGKNDFLTRCRACFVSTFHLIFINHFFPLN